MEPLYIYMYIYINLIQFALLLARYPSLPLPRPPEHQNIQASVPVAETGTICIF